jgi:hypothetical protein
MNDKKRPYIKNETPRPKAAPVGASDGNTGKYVFSLGRGSETSSESIFDLQSPLMAPSKAQLSEDGPPRKKRKSRTKWTKQVSGMLPGNQINNTNLSHLVNDYRKMIA